MTISDLPDPDQNGFEFAGEPEEEDAAGVILAEADDAAPATDENLGRDSSSASKPAT